MRARRKLQRACPAVDEVTGLQMIEIDLTDRVWTIPPTRMKATREHRVPLCVVWTRHGDSRRVANWS